MQGLHMFKRCGWVGQDATDAFMAVGHSEAWASALTFANYFCGY